MAEKTLRLQGARSTLRSVEDVDLDAFYQAIYGEAEPEWKRWDAPYYPLVSKTRDEYRFQMEARLAQGEACPQVVVVEADGEVIGMATYYWEHRESNWLEIGIVIFSPAYWSNGYGTEALTLWINHLFAVLPLVRIGLTTWSGNMRMVRCAEKLGMQMEARLRKCRLWQGTYYDSIRMGILREEWEALQMQDAAAQL